MKTSESNKALCAMGNGKLLYLRIRKWILHQIEDGVWRSGDQIPPDMELAKILGVSHVTVGKAMDQLRREGHVDRTRGMGTFVKISAKNPNRVSSKPIAILYDVIDSETFQAKLFVSVHNAAYSSGHAIKCLSSDRKPDVQLEQLNELAHNGTVAGVIVWPIISGEQFGKFLLTKPPDFPVVLMCRSFEGIDADYSGFDDFHAGMLLANHLVRMGHCRVCCIEARSDIMLRNTDRDRLIGIRAGFTAAGLEPGAVSVFDHEAQCENIGDILSAADSPTALVALGDTVGVKVLAAARQAGIKVPEELAIASFESLDLCSRFENDITAVVMAIEEVGRAAVATLIARLGGDTRLPVQVLHRGHLAVRSTTDISKLKAKQEELNRIFGD